MFVDAGFEVDKSIRKKFGKTVEKVWDGFLYWYRRSLKHGSPLSHFPIVSTIGRILYIVLFFIIFPEIILKYTIAPNLNLQYEFSWWYEKIVLQHKIIIGLMGSDFIHWGLDILTTEHSEKKTNILNKKENINND